MKNVYVEPPHVSQSEAESLIKPHYQLLLGCYKDAWSQWQRLEAEEPDLGARTRATYLSDRIWYLVKLRFQGVDGVRVFENTTIRVLIIDERLMIRFKKLDKRLRSKNVQTKQQVLWVLQLPIPDIPDMPRLTFGYVLNRLQTDIERFAVTMPKGKSVAWWLDVVLDEGDSVVTPFAMPVEEPKRTRTVKPKTVDRKADDAAS